MVNRLVQNGLFIQLLVVLRTLYTKGNAVLMVPLTYMYILGILYFINKRDTKSTYTLCIRGLQTVYMACIYVYLWY